MVNVMVWSWLGAVAFFAFLEAGTRALVSVWFAAGALAAVFAAYAGLGLTSQLLIFVAVSLAAIAALRPLAERFLEPRFVPTNADRLLGAAVRVTEEIDNAVPAGAVYADGKTWTARSADGEVTAAGDVAEVVWMEGVKLIVRPKAAVEQGGPRR